MQDIFYNLSKLPFGINLLCISLHVRWWIDAWKKKWFANSNQQTWPFGSHKWLKPKEIKQIVQSSKPDSLIQAPMT
jgi:hypothetical protein